MEREAWIIDAVRSPRGKGKENGALHPVHPQRILAQVLNALQAPQRLRHRRGRRRDHGLRRRQRRPRHGHRPHGRPRRRLVARRAGRHPQPLLRLGPAGRELRGAWACSSGFQDIVVGGGVESMSRPAPLHVDGFTANNHHLFDQYPMVAAGHLGRPHRHRRGLQPRGVRPARRRQPGPGAGGASPRAASTAASCRSSTTTARLALDHEEFPRPGTTLEDLAKLAPSFEEMGAHTCRGQRAHARPDRAARLPATSTTIRHVHHAGNSLGRRRRRRRPCSSPRPTTPRPTA